MNTLNIGWDLDYAQPSRSAVTKIDSLGEPLCGQGRLRAVLHDAWFAMLGGECCVLTGADGMGKTSACRELLRRVPRSVHAIHVCAHADNGRAALATISHGMAMTRALRAGGERVSEPWRWVLIVDDAHGLDRSTLRDLLSWHATEATRSPTVGLLLAGRPGLEHTLSGLDASARAIAMHGRLQACTVDETRIYLHDWFRLRGLGAVQITEPATRLIHVAAGGVPQRLSRLCSRALRVLELHGRGTLTAMVAARAVWLEPAHNPS